ncbi:MAG TPA: SDR family oxidoreductase [Verrucomicrobiae bacterium]|nr:SDR family oxidoreductase [Verrucomicrobiae bacterium]
MTDSVSKPLAWITGSRGLIGNYLVHASSKFSEWKIRGLTREQLDLLDFAAVRNEFKNDSPQLVIHCAALSQSPACQKNPALARKLNVEVTVLLAELAADIPFFFFSTDLVFDGRKGNYVETDSVNPLSIYAETKVAAEKIVLANPKHTVIRTSLNAGISSGGDRGFNEQLRRTFEKNETLKLFTDEFRSPISAEITARAVWELASKKKPGIYHIAGSERLSRWEIGRLIAAQFPNLNPKIEPESLANYRGAPRSPDTSLNCGKIQKLLSFPLPRFSDWLAENPVNSSGKLENA